MDPIAVLKTIWTYRFWVLPVVVLTLVAGAYVYQFGPRSYEATMSVAIVNPKIPSDRDIEKNPKLEKVNKDNPYLRSFDNSLITDVIVTRLNSSSTAKDVEAAGLGPEYAVGQGVNSNGFVIDINGIGSSPEKAGATARFLGKRLQEDLYSAQKVNGADDSYLFTSLVIVEPGKPVEQFSSRLRSLIMVALGGGILLLGTLSVATSVGRSRAERARLRSESMELEEPSNVQRIADATTANESSSKSPANSARSRRQAAAGGGD